MYVYFDESMTTTELQTSDFETGPLLGLAFPPCDGVSSEAEEGGGPGNH